MARPPDRTAWGERILLVSGLGRCGSSLFMQMLEAGGFPIFPGLQWPAFETRANLGLEPLPPGGGALKWLDPQLNRPPQAAGAVLLTRNPAEQSRSHVKWLRAFGEVPDLPVTRAHRQSFVHDARRARRALKARAGAVLELAFEDLVEHPARALELFAGWTGAELDVAAGAAQVRHRETGVRCLPYLLEEVLIAEAAERG